MKNLRLLTLLIVSSFVLVIQASPSAAQVTTAPNISQFRFVDVASGFSRPLYVTHAGDDRLFVVEQDGRIKIIQNGVVNPTAFLDVSSLVSRGGSEQGLLGLAFHPNYAQNGWFFINYTNTSGHTVVARYTVSLNPNLADSSSATTVLTVNQPYANHNGGHLAFGPDGYLYIALGDGGSSGDPQNRAQNPQTLLGKILRINVNQLPYTVPSNNPFVGNNTYLPEIWSFGLRNPWRFSFDRSTGDMYIGDVGEGTWEEVNFQPAGQGGQNYGWNYYEATHPRRSSPPPNTVMPFAEYSHSSGCSVTGGYVYRGSSMPAMAGVYLYADYCSGIMWTAFRSAAGAWQVQQFTDTNYTISSFGEDRNGTLYIVDYGGRIVRIEQIAAAATNTPLPTHTSVPTSTSTLPPTNTPVPTVTSTLPSTNTLVPTVTSTLPPTNTLVPTVTSTLPPTNTLVPTVTSTVMPTSTEVVSTATVPPTPTPPLPTEPTLRVDVTAGNGTPGETVVASLNLLNVSNLYGLQVECAVNPIVLTGGSRVDGEFNAGNSFFVDSGFQADGIWKVAVSRLQPSTPISGNATAFSLTYTVAAGGASEINCTALAVDQNGHELPLSVQKGIYVGIDEPTAQPTLATETPIPTFTPEPTLTDEPTALPTETMPPALGVINGVVAYQNRPDNAGITVRLLGLDGTPLAELMTNADGGYQFTDVPVGVYSLEFSAPLHLPGTRTDILVESAGQTVDLGEDTLSAGDVDGNGIIDLADAALIGANLGSSVPPAPANTDLTGDSLVNISDLVLVGSNFNMGNAGG